MEVNSATIIADKGMSVNRNIRFLNLGIVTCVISYRIKVGVILLLYIKKIPNFGHYIILIIY